MSRLHRPAGPARLRRVVIAGALLVSTCLLAAPAAAADADALQRVVDESVANASADGITQSISVVDRRTGEMVAGSGGDRQYISESIVKLFTAAYYLVRANGQPDETMRHILTAMIENSDDDIESDLWNVDIVPSMAARYGLPHTTNGPKTGPHDWGWELITADDETTFLAELANDPLVGPLVLDAMAHSASTAADGTDQAFGLNALTGDHGSKQGWTDAGAQWAERAQVHSVGWTDRYFVAILETAGRSTFEEMRTASTDAARAILRAESDTARTTPDPGSAPAGSTSLAPAASDPTPTGPAPATSDALVTLIPALRHAFDVLVADVSALAQRWGR